MLFQRVGPTPITIDEATICDITKGWFPKFRIYGHLPHVLMQKILPSTNSVVINEEVVLIYLTYVTVETADFQSCVFSG